MIYSVYLLIEDKEESEGVRHRYKFKDPDAYRRDRRKDFPLQENGYFVLRFLAKDVGKRLDEVLDTILFIMANRSPRNPQ